MSSLNLITKTSRRFVFVWCPSNESRVTVNLIKTMTLKSTANEKKM